MAKNLVIVESPAKAKTLARFLGSDYQVKSSFGHIRDLPKKGLNIDIEHNFEPTYAISDDKKKVVADLKKAAGQATTIWLASDEDDERSNGNSKNSSGWRTTSCRGQWRIRSTSA